MKELLLKAEKLTFWLILFAWPWQLRYFFFKAEVAGGFFEYGSLFVYLTDLLLLVLIALWLWRRPKISLGPKNVALIWLSLAGLAVLSSLWAVSPMPAFLWGLRLGLWFVFYLYFINEVKSLKEIFWPLFLSIFFQAAVALGQFSTNHSLGLWWTGESPLDASSKANSIIKVGGLRQLRAYGTTPHANILGGVSALFFVLGIWFWERAKYLFSPSRLSNALARPQWRATFLALASIPLFLSYSRSAWLAVFVFLIVWSWGVKKWREMRWPWIILLTVFLVGSLANPQLIGERFILGNRLEKRSVEERLAGFKEWEEIWPQNFLLGTGASSYTQSLVDKEPGRMVWSYKPVHNVFLLSIAELGVFMVIMWFWILWGIVRTLFLWRRGFFVLLSSVSCLGVLAFFDHYLWTSHQGLVIVALIVSFAVWLWGQKTKKSALRVAKKFLTKDFYKY